ncbi:MAG TPA: peroxiredoxin-like family protein [Acidobacteriaceae bacterium]
MSITETLQDQLDAITANTRKLVPADRLAVSEQAVTELFNSGIEDRILKPGMRAPEFELQDASTGKLVHSTDVLALGPMVLSFFRGRWCPYCVTELEIWRDLYPDLRQRNALFVAVSPQMQRQNDFTVQQHSLPFAVLTDPACALAEQFGIAYTVPEYHRLHLRSIMVNIPYVNGENTWRLPLPAVFVIGQDNIIRFSEVHADFRVRPEPADVLAAL